MIAAVAIVDFVAIGSSLTTSNCAHRATVVFRVIARMVGTWFALVFVFSKAGPGSNLFDCHTVAVLHPRPDKRILQ